MDTPLATQYQFGDGSLASERLKLLAAVFGPTTAAFLREAAAPRPSVAIDLGCGPGHTTEVIAETLRPERLLGLDASPSFLAEARARTPSAQFLQLDVIRDPFPVAKTNLLFARYLLSHLPDPAGAIARWKCALAPRGVLLIEELEAVHPVFAEYLSIVEAMLAEQGASLYVGRTLPGLSDPSPGERHFDRAVSFDVDTRQAARMFAMNVPNWRRKPFIQRRYGAAAVRDLLLRLEAMALVPSPANPRWTLRQIGWRASEPPANVG